ncbi:Rdx family-domain-containing protein [Peziza echinospora]|nr:Rdx family-domain-containing protein [Peziza echinospora]
MSTPPPTSREIQGTQVQGFEAGIRYPRVVIEYCTQCKWMLRAAYYAQELLSTFSSLAIPVPPETPNTPYIADISLQPSSSGTFVVSIYTTSSESSTDSSSAKANPPGPPLLTITKHTLWSRALDGGFPETKELKRRVRNVIDPGRGLGHVDRVGSKAVGVKREERGEEPAVEAVVVEGGAGTGGKCSARRRAREAGEAGAERKKGGVEGEGEKKEEEEEEEEVCLDCQ